MFENEKQVAVALFSQGKLPEAMQICERLCAQQDDAAMLCMLGVIHGRYGHYIESAWYCRKALQLSPDYVYAQGHLGNALRQINDFEGARAAFTEVVRKTPNDSNAHYHLGLTLESLGEFEPALRSYRTAQQLNPQLLDAVAGEASVYERQAELEKAYNTVYTHIEACKDNAQLAVQYGNIARKLDLHEDAIERLSTFIKNTSLPSEQVLQVYFVLGRLFDDISSYDEAFDCFARANRLKAISYDSSVITRRVTGLITKFTKINLCDSARATIKSDRLVFIVGMPRSGTSLVEQILSSHPSIKGAGELTYLITIAQNMEKNSATIGSLGTEQLNQFADEYLEKTSRLDSDALRVVDKLPANYLNLGYIELLFPGARIIHCRRDPLDTCLSCYFQNFSRVMQETFDLERIGKYYNNYKRMMEHWKEVITLPMIEVDYEALIEEPRKQMQRLIEFTGMPWDDACLEFHKSKAIVKTASYDQVRLPLYTRSIGRWRNYRKHLGQLIEILDNGQL